MLTLAGLSAFDETVLRRLLTTGEPHTPATLAESLGTPPEQVRRSVRRLVELGLALRDGATVVPVDPRAALTGVVRDRRTELDRLTQTIDELSASFHDRALRTGAASPMEVIVGRSAIAARLRDLMARAGTEILAFDTPPYVASTEGDSEAEIGALARGVAVRAVYATEVLNLPERTERVRALVQLGEQARVAPGLPAKLVIADRREAILPLSEPGGDDDAARCALVHASGLCEALIALFEAVWTQAVPLFAPRAAANPDLLAEDNAILQCLNAGMKDDVIARQLGISERTVRRRVADLAARLGASSRFQIGAQAARRGWV
jgi:DNA-binding Lrp family transcriptional regulator